jgi:HEAT repeat protein
MLVTVIALTTMLGAPLRVDEALETLSTCDDLQKESCLFAGAWIKMGGDPAMPLIFEKAPGMTKIGQIIVVSVIGTNPSKAATETLGKMARESRMDPVVRSMALDQLASRTDAPAKMKGGPLEVGMALVEDDVPAVRQGAVRLVASRVNAKDKKLMGVVEKALGDEDAGVRSEAVLGYGNCACEEAPRVLGQALKDPDMKVRRAAIEALCLVKHPPAVPALVEMLNPRDDVLNRQLGRALRFQTGQNYGVDVQQWRRWLADSGIH